MKSYKKGYVEHWGNDIQAVVTKITITEEDGLIDEDEDELERIGGFDSDEEAIEYLKSKRVKSIEIED